MTRNIHTIIHTPYPVQRAKKSKRAAVDDEESVTNTTTLFRTPPPASKHTNTTPPYKQQIIIITYKMSPRLQSSCSPIMFTKDMYHALHAHTKIATRRMWKTHLLAAHLRAAQNNQLVRVWSRPDAGSLYGKLVGHVVYTHTFEQRLDRITPCDVVLEGFPTWSVEKFLAVKFPGVPLETVVHVFMFMFYPRRARAHVCL